jgi:hypothetical protein
MPKFKQASGEGMTEQVRGDPFFYLPLSWLAVEPPERQQEAPFGTL